MSDIETDDTFVGGPSDRDLPDDLEANVAEAPPKRRNRQRLLRGLQRMSSSPTLFQLGRPRSASSPYNRTGTLSCVSLVSAPSPFAQSSNGSYFSHGSAGNQSSGQASMLGSPMGASPSYDGIESVLAIRKVENAVASSTTIALPAAARRKRKSFSSLWASMPHEIKLHTLSFLRSKELVRASRVNREFYKLCFDGQLWTRFDASEFYQEIPASSLAKIVVAAGPFVKDLNLRGCVQVEHYKRAEMVVKACKNLMNATLEGCRNFQRTALHSLLKNNSKLTNLNLTGLTAVTNASCRLIAQSCPQLEVFNVSFCKHMDARGVKAVVESCEKLRDLRVGEIKGFDNREVSEALFRTNNLERLVLAGCEELDDAAFLIMLQGSNPEIDILTERPIVPPRKLRHLDLTRCSRLTDHGVKALGHLVPDLEGLQLTGIAGVTDAALEPILASTPRLTHLELEDLAELTNSLLSEHLAKAPCAPRLEHLSISSCEHLGDVGMLPVIQKCTRLRSIDMDNTRISDLVLAEAAAMVRARAGRTTDRRTRPQISLNMVVYDCQHVTWTGVLEVLSCNAEVKTPARSPPTATVSSSTASPSAAATATTEQPQAHTQALALTVPTYPTEIIGLKCFYGWQMTVDEHTKRVLRGDLAAASRLERKWAEYQQANEEAGVTGAGGRRRRRRAREAQQVHADEEEGGGTGGVTGRRRARTTPCLVM